MDTEVSYIVETYKDLVLSPSPNSAILKVSDDAETVKVLSSWSIHDLIKAESTKFCREFFLQCHPQNITVLSKGIPCDTSSMSLCAFTKSGNRYAVLRKSKKNDESMFLEIWNSMQKERTFDVSEFKEHGKILDSGDLMSFEWSSNEKYILYVAEAKQKKSESYFKDIFFQKSDQNSGEETTKGEENHFRGTWGESHVNMHHSVLCILEIETGKLEVVDSSVISPSVSVAQATWGPEDLDIVFIGYSENPMRLGLAYCNNRSTKIFSYNLEKKSIECLTSAEDMCMESPVFSPNYETFLVLANKAFGPHTACRELLKCDWKSKKFSTVINLVASADDEEFAGIYNRRISSRWWSKDSRFFFFHTFRRSFLEIFYVNMETGKVKKLSTDKKYGFTVLHDVKDPYMLVSVSSPNIKPHLMIGYLTYSDTEINVIWLSLDATSNFSLKDLSWNVQSLKPSAPNKNYSNLDFDIVTVASDEKKNGTLIIFPHGGPHSNLGLDFYVIVAAFARLGYIVCLVNYRGSVGFGEDSIRSLLGNIGSQDVSDVVDAVNYLKKDESLGIKHVVGFGGSHGGFLVAHLLGQYPALLKAAVIRNPVINLTSMTDISDIPDWCWIESGCSKLYDPSQNTDASIVKEMWEKSPIKYIKNVKAPTLLCLGKNDLRVPPAQGLLFYRYLKADNCTTDVYYYDDNHALSKTVVASDVFMQAALWFQTHLLS